MTDSADVFALLDKMRYDLTAAQGKLTDVKAMLGELNLPSKPRPRCSFCGLTFRGALSLAEHLHTSHDGPVPEHFLAAERAAGIVS